MKIRYLLLLLLAVFSFRNSYAQEYLPQVKSRYYVSDSVTIWKPKPLRAAGEVELTWLSGHSTALSSMKAGPGSTGKRSGTISDAG